MKIEIEISDKQLLNVLISANISGWGKWGTGVTENSLKAMGRGKRTVELIEVDECSDKETSHLLSSGSLMEGIQIMAKKYPGKLEEILDEDRTDMYSGEFLLQLAIFREEKYA